MMCVCICQQQVRFLPPAILMKYIFHTGNAAHVLHVNAARGTQTETRAYMEAHEGKLVSESQAQMELWPLKCHN